jgi:hypothetical protein
MQRSFAGMFIYLVLQSQINKDMWQRIQTVFLALTIACMVISIFLPVWILTETQTGVVHQLYPIHYSVVADGQKTTQYFPYCVMALLMSAAATIAFMELRRFDNRILQIKLGTLNSLVLALVMISIVVFANQLSKELQYGWKYGTSLYLAFGGVLFNWLAIRFIRRDEKIVRDSDRLR